MVPVVSSIVFVSGLGLWPGLLQPVHERVKMSRPNHAVETHCVLDFVDGNPAPTMADLLDPLRLRVEQAAAPVTLVAESIDATLALALALDPPRSLGAAVLHEPLVGAAEPALLATTVHAASRLTAAIDPVAGVQEFLERLVGSDTWSRLHPTARGYTRHNASLLQQTIPPVATWSPASVSPSVATLATAGRGSAPMWHRGAAAAAGGPGRHCGVGRGHLLSVDDPAAFVDLIRVATDAAEGRLHAA